MIMCYPSPKLSKDKETETMQENLEKLWICIEEGEKKLCKLFKKKNKKDGRNNNKKDK